MPTTLAHPGRSKTIAPLTLGPWQGVYSLGYHIDVYRGGDPTKPLTGVDLQSVTQISTSKTLDDVSGTWQITFKDARAARAVKPMDVVRIRLQGHNHPLDTVLRGVVDDNGQSGSADVTSAQQDTVVQGRCMAKYLQVNSLFLPVWDPSANLPTALTFGLGDASQKLGTNVNASTPREIFGWVFRNYVVGLRNIVGRSGTPNARFWMDPIQRFDWVKDSRGKVFSLPFIQFDEDTCDTVMTRMTILGFTEAWVDEYGFVVYRRPQWDGKVAYRLHTDGLINWSLNESDTALSTYVEVVPGGNPGIATGQAQALLAGRAPIPSDYVANAQASGGNPVDPQFIIDTDGKGKVTTKGAKNWYYQKQRQYGLRPYQITSPLLFSRDQAQAQAQGLLRFMLRWAKGGSVTIPGEPNIRLGTTLYLHGELRGQTIARTYYVQGVSHEYVENSHYHTTLQLSHGRDPGDPDWQKMVLPNYDPSQLAQAVSGGVLNPSAPGGATPVSFTLSGGATNPAPGATWSRLDMGFDGAYGSQGAVAPFNGTINGIGITGWPGQGRYFAILNDDQTGPDYTRAMYFAEGAVPLYSNGTRVKAGQQIGSAVASGGTGAPGNFEIGPANTSNFDTLAKSYGLGSSGASKMVQAFAAWLGTLGAGSPTDTSVAGNV